MDTHVSLTLLAVLLAFRAAAADTEQLDYAFEAYDADGWWIAGGRLELIVVEPSEEGHRSIWARSQQNWVDPYQSFFARRSNLMQGRIEDKRIELVPSLFAHSGYISLSGEFLSRRFGAFEGEWRHRHARGGQGYFRAWPIGETARRYRKPDDPARRNDLK